MLSELALHTQLGDGMQTQPNTKCKMTELLEGGRRTGLCAGPAASGAQAGKGSAPLDVAPTQKQLPRLPALRPKLDLSYQCPSLGSTGPCISTFLPASGPIHLPPPPAHTAEGQAVAAHPKTAGAECPCLEQLREQLTSPVSTEGAPARPLCQAGDHSGDPSGRMTHSWPHVDVCASGEDTHGSARCTRARRSWWAPRVEGRGVEPACCVCIAGCMAWPWL